jgi:hypothetical protein
MALPVPNLDDRRFDDLSTELQARLLRQLPELTQIAPGDPMLALVDLFAWMTETVIYRANRIPERQRRAFLNLLQLPLRPALPARGLVSIDSLAGDALPGLVTSESSLAAGKVQFSTRGEVQPTPLELRVVVKQQLSSADLAADGITLDQLRDQHGLEPNPFRPVSLTPGKDALTTAGTLDNSFYLALCAPKTLIAQADVIRQLLAGVVINIGLGSEVGGGGVTPPATSAPARRLEWDLLWWPDPQNKPLAIEALPLEVVADTSKGGLTCGVVRLRLPRNAAFLSWNSDLDPMEAGMYDLPPEPPADLKPGQMLFWLRLRLPSENVLQLGYVGVNAVDVLGQGIARNQVIAIGTGRPDQSAALAQSDVDSTSLVLEVQSATGMEVWSEVAHFSAQGAEDAVYLFDAGTSTVRFGDGQKGRRPTAGAVIRARYYRYGGGSAGNLPTRSIKSLSSGDARLKLRHDWPTQGGVDAESVDQAERRIPAFLTHRERAVTAADYSALVLDNPLRPTGRADTVPGFYPGNNLQSIRRDVPGVISVFVLPPGEPALAAAPRPTAGMLADVYDYLSARTLVGTELYVLSPQYQPISLALSLDVIDPTTEQQTFRAVELALLSYLWSLAPGGPRGRGWPMGRMVELNELRTQAGRVCGVDQINGLRLFYQDLETKAWLESSRDLTLVDYQLPELMAVSLTAGSGMPVPPQGYGQGAAASGPGSRSVAVPVPVIPDIC